MREFFGGINWHIWKLCDESKIAWTRHFAITKLFDRFRWIRTGWLGRAALKTVQIRSTTQTGIDCREWSKMRLRWTRGISCQIRTVRTRYMGYGFSIPTKYFRTPRECGYVQHLWRSRTWTMVRFISRGIEGVSYGKNGLLIDGGLQNRCLFLLKMSEGSVVFNPPLTWLCPSVLIVDPRPSSTFGFVRFKDEEFTFLSRRIRHLERKKRKERANFSIRAVKSFRRTVGPRTPHWMKWKNVTNRRCICLSDGLADIMVWGMLVLEQGAVYPVQAFIRFYSCIVVEQSPR